jgi:diguanylate cyclase (GGDEF)-like protein
MPKQHSSGPIARWRGEFTSPATEDAFLRDQGDVIRRDLTRSLSFCSAFYLAFALTDVTALGYHRHTAILFLARLAVAVVALAGIVITRRSAHPARTAYRAASAVATFGMATFLLVAYLRPGDMLLHGMSMAIMLSIVYLFIPNSFVNAIVIAAGASVGFLALACAVGTLSESHVLTMAMLLLLANLFGAAAARRDAHLWREQYWTQQILTNLSVRDPLTGAFNRRHLNAGLLENEVARAHRQGLPLTLVMCDLDGFKIINDTHGHQAGDTLLRDFARLLLAMTREGIDTVVRYGGEEFLLILPDTGMAGGHDLAERVRAQFASASSQHGDVRLATTASFGVVSARLASPVPGAGSPASIAQALIAHADELMYAAKRSGRNRVHATEWSTQQAA